MRKIRYLPWLREPIEKLHNGYFAQDKKGTLKDTRVDTQADDEVYNLIMKEKEKLLSTEEPPDAVKDIAPAVIDLLSSYQIERHIRRERDDGANRLKKEVLLSPEFKALWERISPKTTYRVEFKTEDIVRNCVKEIRRMEPVGIPQILIKTGGLDMGRGGISARAVSVAEERSIYDGAVPDVLAYLQGETELTRSTLLRILRNSGRMTDCYNNPQKFLDKVAAIIKNELHRLLIDGIKYERPNGAGTSVEWEMRLFKNEELINYLTALRVNKSVYEYVVYDSEVEREFARQLDDREDIKLFVKLPGWFVIDTPIGQYNPDWAIIKQNGQALYLVRETKGTRVFLQLRTSEADKIRCGKKHFETLGVPFDVGISVDDV